MNTKSNKEYVPVQIRGFRERDTGFFPNKEAPATDDLGPRTFTFLIRDLYGLRLVKYVKYYTRWEVEMRENNDGYQIYTDRYHDHYHFILGGKHHALVQEGLDAMEHYYTEGCEWCGIHYE